jgi:hypothetical protein
VDLTKLLGLVLAGEDGDATDSGAQGLILADFLEEHGISDLAAGLRQSPMDWYGDNPGSSIRVREIHRVLLRRGVLPGGNDQQHRHVASFRARLGAILRGIGRPKHCGNGETFSSPGRRAAVCRWYLRRVLGLERQGLVSCYPRRPTPRAVRVTFPRYRLPFYAEVNRLLAQDEVQWLTLTFPNYARVVVGEQADAALRDSYDWIVL